MPQNTHLDNQVNPHLSLLADHSRIEWSTPTEIAEHDLTLFFSPVNPTWATITFTAMQWHEEISSLGHFYQKIESFSNRWSMLLTLLSSFWVSIGGDYLYQPTCTPHVCFENNLISLVHFVDRSFWPLLPCSSRMKPIVSNTKLKSPMSRKKGVSELIHRNLNSYKHSERVHSEK